MCVAYIFKNYSLNFTKISEIVFRGTYQEILENKKFIQRKKKLITSAKFNIKLYIVYTIIYAV